MFVSTMLIVGVAFLAGVVVVDKFFNDKFSAEKALEIKTRLFGGACLFIAVGGGWWLMDTFGPLL